MSNETGSRARFGETFWRFQCLVRVKLRQTGMYTSRPGSPH